MATPSTTTNGTKVPKLLGFAIPLLGIMAAIQGSSPNINSTALVSLTRDLNMAGGQVALAASIQTIAIAASVITTGVLADRLGRRKVLLAALLGQQFPDLRQSLPFTFWARQSRVSAWVLFTVHLLLTSTR